MEPVGSLLGTFVPAARWRGGHRMTIYTWARPRRFARLPRPGAALLRRRCRRARARPLLLAAPAARAPGHSRTPRPRGILFGALHARAGRQGLGARLERRPAQPAQLRRHRAPVGGTVSLWPDRTIPGSCFDELLTVDRVPAVAVVGYSLGGNLAMKLAGEFGDAPPSALKARLRRVADDGTGRVRGRARTSQRTASTSGTS